MAAASYHQDGLGSVVLSPRYISPLRKLINIIGCIISLPLYWLVTVHCRWPVTLDLIITVTLTELNRWVNEGRRIAFRENEGVPSPCREKGDLEKIKMDVERLQSSSADVHCMAAVVGWREDPSLFKRALESYQNTKCCAFLLVGIDGDEVEDQDMVDVFDKVYPHRSVTIHVPEPLGEVAQVMKAKEVEARKRNKQPMDEAQLNAAALQHCVQFARNLLTAHNVTFSGSNAITQICLRQRHVHKKGIMFTSYVFALVIADILGIEFLWSSDSDTLVLEGSLSRSVDAMASDPTIGGASSGLVVHNGHETMVTSLAETVYWGELYLTRSSPAATATSDCQSGPSTVFRLAALPPILVPWYMQTIYGKRMIINEDRHLTTNLLSRGWGVVFASDVLTATDTPTTLARWLRQQVRWARATHIESLLQPKVYIMSHPLLFYSMAKREFGPLIAAGAILYYFFTSKQLIVVSVADLSMRILVSVVYNLLRNPHRLQPRSLKWIIPGILFYHIPLPAVHVWSMFTLTADGWGTSMRASEERAKKDSVGQAWFETGFFVVWMGVIAGVAAKWISANVLMGLGGASTVLFFAGSVALASFVGWKLTIDKVL